MPHLLYIVTPVWGRADLLRRVLGCWSRLRGAHRAFDVRLLAVVSPEDETDAPKVARLLADVVVEAPNSPLGAKFNAGVKEAGRLGAAYVAIFGSDTFVLQSVLATYAEAIALGYGYVGFADIYMADLDEGEAIYWTGYTGRRAGEPVGPGRLLSRPMLSRMEWTPYDAALERNLDGSMTRLLPAPFVATSRPHRMISVKSADSITPMGRFPDAERVDYAALMRHYITTV